ncbi:unnamed protein product [Caenorhabditis nigoni]
MILLNIEDQLRPTTTAISRKRTLTVQFFRTLYFPSSQKDNSNQQGQSNSEDGEGNPEDGYENSDKGEDMEMYKVQRNVKSFLRRDSFFEGLKTPAPTMIYLAGSKIPKKTIRQTSTDMKLPFL